MSHTDPVILALRALGEAAGTAHDAAHAESCADCRAELARLTEVVRLARDPDPAPAEFLEVPPRQVWDRIAAATGVTAALNGSAPDHGAQDYASPDRTAPEHAALNGATAAAASPAAPAEPPASPAVPRTGPRRRAAGFWPRGRLTGALAGLAAGVIIGVGGAAGVSQLVTAPPARVVAQIELSPLPQFPQWQGSTGTAVMRATEGQQQIVITLRAPARSGFYEVWLLARDGVSMISLGDLSASHTGTFTVPPGVDLRDYSRIDISLQPFDGSTQHAKTSVVRGSLPATALGRGTPARS